MTPLTPRKTIAVAMIVKNEEALLARCLASVKDADAIYIADTGSIDRTVEIARKYTDNVFLDWIWTDSFCDAQNFVKSKVKEDWILSIDADEFLDCSFDEVRKAVELATNTVRVKMFAEGGKNDFGFPRLFRNSPDIYWEQAIHKHLNLPGEGEDVGDVRIVYGHSPAHFLDPDRSLRMLEHTCATEVDPVRNLYYLGREYWYKQRYQECVDTLLRYSKVANRFDELADAYLIMAQAYTEMKKPNECAQACLQAILINSNFKEAIEYMATIVMPENSRQWLRMADSADNTGVLWQRVEALPRADKILLAPHNDDEALFAAYTIMREKPLVIVVTDSFIQPERGDAGCTAEIRRQETIEAMKIAGAPVVFLGIKDTELTEDLLITRLKDIRIPEVVYAPAIQGGNVQHDIVGRVAKKLFGGRVKCYTTYTKTELYTTGTVEVRPTQEEKEKKQLMCQQYQSQINLASTVPHFIAVDSKSEWLTGVYKRVLIAPYFGRLPEWFPKFEWPKGYEVIVDIDIDSFRKRVKDKLGIDYPGRWGTGKVWDYRCALGLLYEDEIKNYDYWGHCDFDMVFGDVDKWFDDETLGKLDIWSNHHSYVCGPWTLYKNVDYVNRLFMQYPGWKEKMIHPETNAWVENEFSRLVEAYVSFKYSFQQGNPYAPPPLNLKKVDGRLYQDDVEIPMFHFRNTKQWPL